MIFVVKLRRAGSRMFRYSVQGFTERDGAIGDDCVFEADVLGHVVSEEPNVRLVRAKVALGEAEQAREHGSDAGQGSRLRVVDAHDSGVAPKSRQTHVQTPHWPAIAPLCTLSYRGACPLHHTPAPHCLRD